MRPVAITGIGLVSPLGLDLETTARRLFAGEPGLAPPADPRLAAMGVPGVGAVALAATAGADRSEHLALLAARAALRDAGLAAAALPERAAISLAASKGAVWAWEAQLADRRAPRLPLSALSPAAPALFLARELGVRGETAARPAACATGLVAVLHGVREVAAGRAELFLAGASEASLTPFIHGGFAAMGALAREAGVEPGRAVRPFDERRRGFLLGEGAAVFVLEPPERAAARGARVRALVLGGAELCDAHALAAPQPEGRGLEAAMRLALERAALPLEELGGLWLHGAATRAGDAAEIQAAARLAAGRPRPLPATATKGLTGHLLGASGAMELALAALALERGRLPAVANLERPLPSGGVRLSRGAPEPLLGNSILTVCAGFGGHLAAAVLRRPE